MNTSRSSRQKKGRKFFVFLIAVAIGMSALELPTCPSSVLAGVILQDINPDKSFFYSTANARGASGGRVNGLASIPGTNEVFYAAITGGPYVLAKGGSIILDAGASRDPDGQPLSFEWNLNNDENFNDASGPDPIFNLTGLSGVFPVRVKVSAGGAFDIAATDVIVIGNALKVRPVGYWQHQFRGRGKTEFTPETLNSYLTIVDYMSKVFKEVRDISTISSATDVLFPAQNRGNATEHFDRELLTVWLNFAIGAIGLNDPVDTNGDNVPDTPFATAMSTAESVQRLSELS